MIALIRGHLIVKTPQYAIVDVNGVGYKVFMPLSTFSRLPDNNKDEVTLHTYTHLREDAIQLYGFLSAEERDFFTTLITISGIGPKMGLNILSGSSLSELMKTVESEDAKRLSMIPGVGKKTAARIILELKEKLPSISPFREEGGIDSAIAGDALSALVNLGYTRAPAYDAIKKACKDSKKMSIEEIIREALKTMVKG
ncbi:MAG: Holliday junction branch migration protein RuvA [Nitrospirae bacterium]|nr:Holliday junction branch migration protein RuvA [Nitrospirota bacterium]